VVMHIQLDRELIQIMYLYMECRIAKMRCLILFLMVGSLVLTFGAI
jgi:hypothetical protein